MGRYSQKQYKIRLKMQMGTSNGPTEVNTMSDKENAVAKKAFRNRN